MTFDELWRHGPHRDPQEDDDMFDVFIGSGPVSDQPDEAEVNRFLEWLEQNLP